MKKLILWVLAILLIAFPIATVTGVILYKNNPEFKQWTQTTFKFVDKEQYDSLQATFENATLKFDKNIVAVNYFIGEGNIDSFANDTVEYSGVDVKSKFAYFVENKTIDSVYTAELYKLTFVDTGKTYSNAYVDKIYTNEDIEVGTVEVVNANNEAILLDALNDDALYTCTISAEVVEGETMATLNVVITITEVEASAE